MKSPDSVDRENEINTLHQIEKGWASTCKVLLGTEIDPIQKYSGYLQDLVEPCKIGKSAISGKQIFFYGDYPEGSKFISGEEIRQYESIMAKAKLDIDQIKDIDSISEAISECVYYSGNNILGNSSMVAKSDRVIDSNFVYNSNDVIGSKYVATSHIVRYAQHIYGCTYAGKGVNFAIKSYEVYEANRMFECLRVYHSGDCYYSANIDNCQDCLFSFNIKSKRKCIGNLELPTDKFSQLKQKLLEDIVETFKSTGKVISISDIIGGGTWKK
jgi:hypothetical protein